MKSKKVFIFIAMLPVSFANAEEKTDKILDELHFSVSDIRISHIGYEVGEKSTYLKVKNSFSLVNKISRDRKVYAGISLMVGKEKTDYYDSVDREIGLIFGYRNNFRIQEIEFFSDYGIGANYRDNIVENKSIYMTRGVLESKTLFITYSVGKTLQINKKHAIEGKFGILADYTKYNFGWVAAASAPVGSLGWAYSID